MTRLARLRRAAFGFFVDDAFLGLGTAATLLAAVLCRALLHGRPLAAGAILAGGCLLALTLSVARAAAAHRRSEAPAAGR
ncbi:MAG: hypothetical protein JWQ97_4124 [Phenylobacterium sp.]|nr:hypothetical protein [Phenylobacterium sp.]